MNLFSILLVSISFWLSSQISWAETVPQESSFEWIFESQIGGQGTHNSPFPSVQSYRNPLSHMEGQRLDLHREGDGLFERNFSDDRNRRDYGLGPVFNHQSCAGCHIRDGRGALPLMSGGNTWTQLAGGQAIFLRISIEPNEENRLDHSDNNWTPIPVPGFSDQLFHLGSYRLREDRPGVGQAEVWMRYDNSEFVYPDGTRISLRKPVFQIRNPYDLNPNGMSRLFENDVRTSPRMTPPMIGLGLIEAIAEADIRRLARRDLSKWGIHGKSNEVRDLAKVLQGSPTPFSLGRFGLKANTPSVFHQSLGALRGDLGVTSWALQDESIKGTVLMDRFLPYWKPSIEAGSEITEPLVFYSQTLAVPSRREVENPEVIHGAKTFSAIGCTNCHHPSFTTGPHSISELSNQKINPFSDFLIHDMGEGLADGRQDFLADGRSWRTSPLWGIGLAQIVNPRAGFLHDGRARTLEEAILWHSGESEKSHDLFINLTKNERSAILRFLKSL